MRTYKPPKRRALTIRLLDEDYKRLKDMSRIRKISIQRMVEILINEI